MSNLKGPYESQQMLADDSRRRRLAGHLNIYDDAVIASLCNAESVLIFGPGEAKDELKNVFRKKASVDALQVSKQWTK